MHRSSSKKLNKAWLHDHINDPYVKLAQRHQYRARAAFKLIGIDEQDHLIKPGMTVVDLGSAPGSWCQVVRRRLSAPHLAPDVRKADDARSEGAQVPVDGRIIALDLLPMEHIPGVDFLQGDFREQSVLDQLEKILLDRQVGHAQVDLVLSDMAPNLSGVGVADTARMADLAELAVDFAVRWLKPDGALLIKVFHGSGYSQLVRLFKDHFLEVLPRKPKASRDRSAETYLLGRRLKPGLR
ncbi:MAG: RlmE family RNA methyltransferase [Lautropia sp.]|nr:RlmE family RNA methyltransferase [Lautropia sp.]